MQLASLVIFHADLDRMGDKAERPRRRSDAVVHPHDIYSDVALKAVDCLRDVQFRQSPLATPENFIQTFHIILSFFKSPFPFILGCLLFCSLIICARVLIRRCSDTVCKDCRSPDIVHGGRLCAHYLRRHCHAGLSLRYFHKKKVIYFFGLQYLSAFRFVDDRLPRTPLPLPTAPSPPPAPTCRRYLPTLARTVIKLLFLKSSACSLLFRRACLCSVCVRPISSSALIVSMLCTIGWILSSALSNICSSALHSS